MLYNAECDALSPKSMNLLRSELKNLEKAWKYKPVVINDNDFEEYRKQHIVFLA